MSDLVGKQSATQTAYASVAAHDVGTPGKQTLTTGIPIVDSAGGKTSQRLMLEVATSGRINRAGTQCAAAVVEVFVDKMMESDSEVPAAAMIVLSVISSNAAIAAQGAIKSLLQHGGPEAALSKVAITGMKVAETEMSDVSEGEIEAIVGAAVDLAKDKAKPIANHMTTDTGTAKTQATNYLDQIAEKVNAAYQHLAEDPPGYASDAQLLALCESFDHSRHTLAGYREQIEARVRRYMGSHAKDIGRTSPQPGISRETRVAWVKHTDGTKQLAYVSQDFGSGDAMTSRSAGAYWGQHALSLKEPATDTHNRFGNGQRRQSTPITRVGFLGFVEPDLVEPALEHHEAVWLHEPETYDYSLIVQGGEL